MYTIFWQMNGRQSASQQCNSKAEMERWFAWLSSQYLNVYVIHREHIILRGKYWL
jgi:hypothetical protein